MEPEDLTLPARDDARLEAWCRANLSAAPLPDDGFSARVVAALPPPTWSRRLTRQRLCLAGLSAGAAVAVAGVLFSEGPAAARPALGTSLAEISTLFATPAAALACGATVVSLWFAFRSHGSRPDGRMPPGLIRL